MFGNNFFVNSVLEDSTYNELLNDVSNIDYSIFYRGTVVENSDPLGLGRVRVRVPQIYGSEDQRDSSFYVPTYAIPWATSAIMAGAGNNTGAFLIPNIGDTVFVTFENQDENLPIYFGGILTRDGENKFIGTGDVNSNQLYKASDMDFNTDISNRAQRVLYKSLKGATIIVDDKDGDESIKIIDQLGQFISMENVSSGPLNRDRSGGVVDKKRSGRIVIKDAYEDSVALHDGEIHIKTPRLVIETDEIKKVGYNDEFPAEVDYAEEILGDTGRSIHIVNNTDKTIAFGLNVYNFEDYEDFYANVTYFDEIRNLAPGETEDITFTEVNLENMNEDIFIITVLNENLCGKWNHVVSWNGDSSKTIDISALMEDSTVYVGPYTSLLGMSQEEVNTFASGNSTYPNRYLILTSSSGEDTYYSVCGAYWVGDTRYPEVQIAGYLYFTTDEETQRQRVKGFYPKTRKTLDPVSVRTEDGYTTIDHYCLIPPPRGIYTYSVRNNNGTISSSGTLPLLGSSSTHNSGLIRNYSISPTMTQQIGSGAINPTTYYDNGTIKFKFIRRTSSECDFYVTNVSTDKIISSPNVFVTRTQPDDFSNFDCICYGHGDYHGSVINPGETESFYVECTEDISGQCWAYWYWFEEEAPEYDTYTVTFNNNTDTDVYFGANTMGFNDYSDCYTSKSAFDHTIVLAPGEVEEWTIYNNTSDESTAVNPFILVASCLNQDYVGEYNQVSYWNGSNTMTLNASDFVSRGTQYRPVEIRFKNLIQAQIDVLKNNPGDYYLTVFNGSKSYRCSNSSSYEGQQGYEQIFDFGFTFFTDSVDDLFIPMTSNNIYQNGVPLTEGNWGYSFTCEDESSLNCSGQLYIHSSAEPRSRTQYNIIPGYRQIIRINGSFTPSEGYTFGDLNLRWVLQGVYRVENTSEARCIGCITITLGHYVDNVFEAEFRTHPHIKLEPGESTNSNVITDYGTVNVNDTYWAEVIYYDQEVEE